MAQSSPEWRSAYLPSATHECQGKDLRERRRWMRPWRVRLPIRMLPSSPCADRLEGPVLPQGGLPQREADADRDLEEVPSSEEPRRASQWFRPDRVKFG